ncbi:MAG: Hsp20/alpha crystallin family protein [Kiritimatiellae bacterium]|nr:Hsp20/alpha crystallin family protein [Kiritimatiellia bacterium]
MTTQTAELQTKENERTRDLPVAVPATDIYETENGIALSVDLPGVRQEQVEVTLENRVLTISARSEAVDPAGYDAVHRDFEPVEYRRSFTLTEDVDRAAISARLKNGVLHLALPKAAESQPRRIEVKTEH